MKKYIYSLVALAAIMSFASCSSEDNEIVESVGNAKAMTFIASQEGDVNATRAGISTTDNKVINWESGDQISIFDGTSNNVFTLMGGAGTSSATFEGTAASTDTYTAVYPYQSEAALSGSSVTNVTIPATQTATGGSFDKAAALMMAQSKSTTLQFKNAVGFVKVTPTFDCSKIELKAAGASEHLAGKGTLTYNGGAPTIAFTSDQSTTITLNGNIVADKSYYIAVPAITLSAGWAISFTADDNKVYTRKGTKSITFTRSMVTNLGSFATDGSYWYNARGEIVTADQEIDMGLTVTIDGANYKVIFAKSNLTATGLAAKESDFGDYFAWAATEPWCTAYTSTTSFVTPTAWKSGKSSGYVKDNAPYFSGEIYTKYTTSNSVLEAEDDAAHVILGGDWQLPTKEIWPALYNTSNYTWDWTTQEGYSGRKVTNKSDNSKSLFLPAAGYFYRTSSYDVGSLGYYWSGAAYLSTYAYGLLFGSGGVYPQYSNYRYYGFCVRPVRLVAVTE